MKSALTEDTNAIYLSILITKLATQIISVSQYSDAIVSLIAYNNGLEPNSPYWHIDKTHEEEVELKQDEYNKQYVFLSTLKGNSTLYYPVDYAARTTLSALIQESSHSYYWTNEIFNKSLVSFAKFGQGSVHLAGYKYGAIHGTPDGKERLLMITTPSNSNTIKNLKNEHDNLNLIILIQITSDSLESRALYKTYNVGIKWVDALNGTVRPILAYSFFLLYSAVKYANLYIA